MHKKTAVWLSLLMLCFSCGKEVDSGTVGLDIEQITSGPANHFFGYIGHVQNIPWNASGRFIVGLRVSFYDRMPTASDIAEIILIDTTDNHSVMQVEETRAWNPQQGTMLYWNPDKPETQFFFNDRDPETNEIFCVLFDIEENRRVKEYRYSDTPIGNGGVRQNGGSFLGINYGRLARLRKVTGYSDAYDWTIDEMHPEDDGVFLVDVVSAKKKLLVSFRELREALIERYPRIQDIPLFINHTLWNRDGDRIFFFVRGNFRSRETRINVPMTIRPDGSELKEQRVFIGGHPEWETGSNMIGHVDGNLVLYDSVEQVVKRSIGSQEIFPDPENDVALSPDGKWIVQGLEVETRTAYTVFRRSDHVWTRTRWFDQREFSSGDLRIDAAPKWNRSSSKILFSSLTDEPQPTRQMFVAHVRTAR